MWLLQVTHSVLQYLIIIIEEGNNHLQTYVGKKGLKIARLYFKGQKKFKRKLFKVKSSSCLMLYIEEEYLFIV